MIRVVSGLNALAMLCFLLALAAATFSLGSPDAYAQTGVFFLILTPLLRVFVLSSKYWTAWVLLVLWGITALYWIIQ